MKYFLHDVFFKSEHLFANHKAIINENGESLTYHELYLLANKFANYLKTLEEINSSVFIGILATVHSKSIAAILGILNIGKAYVPLDESSPCHRLKHIVNNAKINTIIVDANFVDKHQQLLQEKNIKHVILLNDLLEDSFNLTKKLITFKTVSKCIDSKVKNINKVSDDLAYILHTSGSTGIPKGIMLSHRNARTFVDWMQKEFQLTPADIVMSRAPFKFDLSIFDIFNTLKAGATLVCFDWLKKNRENKHADYVNLLEKYQATILYTTPSTFISLMNKGNISDKNLHLRTVMYAGEPFPMPYLRKLQKALPNTKIANIYGPTETNIITYHWVNDNTTKGKDVPLGRVVDDTEIIVVSADKKRICEPNEVGELWCRGGTVTLGYLGLQEKTNEHLVDSPFHQYPMKFWRTGDYGYYDEYGILHYRGRKDHMVKVLGYRIEIEEVESALATIPCIEHFCVVPIQDEKYGNRLYCFYSTTHNKNYPTNYLIEQLSNTLPPYMIPYKFIFKDNLPKTSSEKIDRIALTNEITMAITDEV